MTYRTKTELCTEKLNYVLFIPHLLALILLVVNVANTKYAKKKEK